MAGYLGKVAYRCDVKVGANKYHNLAQVKLSTNLLNNQTYTGYP